MKTVNVAAAVIRDGDRILATERGYGAYKDGWEFPGGKVEDGESYEDALVREIREELNIQIAVGHFLGLIDYDYPDFHLHMFVYWAKITDGLPVLLEHEDARWLKKEELDSVDWLPADRTIIARVKQALSHELIPADTLFDVQALYDRVYGFAQEEGYAELLQVLEYACKAHEGQVRKPSVFSGERVPYIVHPLTMCVHAISLGLDDEKTLETVLLHDVCEDCGVRPEELPVSAEVQDSVRRLTKQKGIPTEEYYAQIRRDQRASYVKLLDRINNVSGMTASFTEKRLEEYVRETEECVLPLLAYMKAVYLQDADTLYVLEYHLRSVNETVKAGLLRRAS